MEAHPAEPILIPAKAANNNATSAKSPANAVPNPLKNILELPLL